MKRVDVAVVGAGPAGTATAILLAERGLTVVLLDRAGFLRPKVCGEYLSPQAARLLDRLGVLKDVDAAGAPPLRGMRLVAPDGTALCGAYPTAGPWRGYRDHAMAIPREVLDRILLERARSLPVEVRERHRITGLIIEDDHVTGIEGADARGWPFAVRSRLVVSVVARVLGLVRPRAPERLALIQDVQGLDGFDQMSEIYIDPPDYSVLSPVTAGLVNLSLMVPLAHARPFRNRLETFFHARLKQLRHLMPRLRGMRPQGRPVAMGPLAYRVMAPRHGGVLLSGDAAGVYDPFMSEGLHAALHSAELLVEVDKEWTSRALRFVIARRPLADRLARALARRPALLDALMGVIGDFIPPRELLRWSTLRQLL